MLSLLDSAQILLVAEISMYCIGLVLHKILFNFYLIATYPLHNLQTMLSNALFTVMGKGGQDEKVNYVMNIIQILHGVYKIQNYHEQENIKELWTYLSDNTINTKFKRLEEPVLTRWWLVGA